MKNHINEEIQKPWKFSHGHSFSSEGRSLSYITWTSMHRRCSDKNNKNYGGRGISVCERWSDFSLFLEDMGERVKGFTIDRIDSDGNYEPSNCKWASSSEQAKNKRASILTEINGEEMNLSEASELYGVPQTTIYRRYHQGLRGLDLIEKSNRNRYRVGEKATSKLTWAQVREIRKMLEDGFTHSVIGGKYGVSQSVISEIGSNKTWKAEFDPIREHYAIAHKAGVYD